MTSLPTTRRPRALVTGAAGMLSRSLVPRLTAAGWHVLPTDIDLTQRSPWRTPAPQLHHLDIRSRGELEQAARAYEPDVILHLAAETSLEVCETDPRHAELTNAEGTRNVARVCATSGARMLYVSTAGVFDGTKVGAYTEEDAPNPLNHYGATKLVGEQIVRELQPDALIVRAGWMVGAPGEKDHKFVGKILGQLAGGARTVYAVGDKWGSPTYSPDFSATVDTLLRGDAPGGTYHSVSECDRSRFEIAQEIVAQLGLTDVDVVEVSSDHFAESFFAPRPASEILRNTRLAALGVDTMRPWPAPLEECLAPWHERLHLARAG